MSKTLYRIQTALLFLSVLSVGSPPLAEELMIQGYYGDYDAEQKISGFPSKSLTGPKTEKWTVPVPTKAYHIGVLFPHLKDPYWESANYGIISHARWLNLKITLYTAGAYSNFGNQRMQLMQLATRKKVDGILLASVDYNKMDPFVEEVSNLGIPIVALINDIHAPKIKSKIMVSFFEMGYKLGQYVLQNSHQKELKIALLPGPQKSGWAADTVKGFFEAISDFRAPRQKITLLKPLYGDTRKDVQRMRLDILNRSENHGLDFIVANAVAAVEAVSYLAENREIHPTSQIVSTYITSKVYEELERGNILAALSDQSISQCQIALDMVAKILDGNVPGKDFPFRVSPLIPLITRENIGQYEYEKLFGEKGFTPVFSEF
ncbi:MAG: TMAO reductase system periplasmic protein TorT [Desulfobacteraceae bacterium]|nr:TMAO reductase system periplasmic protein TorT [Desulfobacteraceae bacterium]